jgi:hypothetical protein
VSNWANDILGNVVVIPSEVELDLAIVTVADLGFEEGATREDIYRVAEDLGLQVLPPDVGPQLRLQYAEQPRGEWLLIGMKPITTTVGPVIFFIGNDDDGCWLSTRCGRPDSFWLPDRRWVFSLRK